MASLRAAAALVVVGVAMWAAPVAAGAADTAWTAPSGYGSGWSQYSTSRLVGFRKDAGGFVHLRGMLMGGTSGATVFTLPTGYRPESGQVIEQQIESQGSTGPYVDIRDDGTVDITGGSLGYVSLDGVIFYAGPADTVGGGSGMTNPMTTAQDLIVGGTSGAAARLGVGTSGQVLAVGSGGVVGWASAASSAMSLSAFTGDALSTVNQLYSLILAVGALLVLGVGYTVARGLSK